ncbi:MAG: ribosome biogenesis GTP-binding protein YihA/YsxC [Sphaerochaetaceae bacterium]|nr:ribosome biogenesis GTP-binding protein YihA/YsxC [Sphaerochaetaceae bacterium]
MKPNLHNITLAQVAGKTEQFVDDNLYQFAFAGRSNVGKSSLINSLLDRKALAKVSSNPGHTVTVNYYNLDDKLYFVDLPGYGYAKRGGKNKNQLLSVTDSYFTQNPNVDLLKSVIQLVDLKVGPTSDDKAMIDFMNQLNIPYIIVATKADKLKKAEAKKALMKLKSNMIIKQDTLIIPYSAKTGQGKMELLTEIYKRAELI